MCENLTKPICKKWFT